MYNETTQPRSHIEIGQRLAPEGANLHKFRVLENLSRQARQDPELDSLMYLLLTSFSNKLSVDHHTLLSPACFYCYQKSYWCKNGTYHTFVMMSTPVFYWCILCNSHQSRC